jgi:hypothetical protein
MGKLINDVSFIKPSIGIVTPVALNEWQSWGDATHENLAGTPEIIKTECGERFGYINEGTRKSLPMQPQPKASRTGCSGALIGHWKHDPMPACLKRHLSLPEPSTSLQPRATYGQLHAPRWRYSATRLRLPPASQFRP